MGASLSIEFGYQRAQYSTSTWNIEIRPIIDKQKGRLYWSVNPAFDRGIVGLPSDQQWNFSPDAKISWDFTKQVTFGLEYYGGWGPVSNLYPFTVQSQQFVPAFDLNVSPKWEINFGVGVGVTAGTDHMLVKAIIGRRFDWGKRHAKGDGSGNKTNCTRLQPQRIASAFAYALFFAFFFFPLALSLGFS